MTPVNWHLTPAEVAYIVDNCEAKAFIADIRLASSATQAATAASGLRIKLAVGGPIEGFASYDTLVARESGANINDPIIGSQMLYTSGTTGHPKGVYRGSAPAASSLLSKMVETARFNNATDLAVVTGPLYRCAAVPELSASALGVRLRADGQMGRGRNAASRRRIPHHAYACRADHASPHSAFFRRRSGAKYDLSTLRLDPPRGSALPRM